MHQKIMILCRFQGFPDFVTSVNIFHTKTKQVLEEDPLSRSSEKTCRAFCSNVAVTGLGGGNRSWGDDGGHHCPSNITEVKGGTAVGRNCVTVRDNFCPNCRAQWHRSSMGHDTWAVKLAGAIC